MLMHHPLFIPRIFWVVIGRGENENKTVL
jgi:hypothetical protein